MRRAATALALACLGFAAGTPAAAANKHLGPATCASTACHGKLAPDAKRNVPLNEYRTWLNDDSHSRAFKVLQSAASQDIARKLGLPNAAGAKICLDCHADNVPAAERGPKFQLSDGVGCESCHGGAEKWIESHAALNATHKDNVARGMYPSEQPVPRATLCLSCHLGTKDAFATHQIMGAGHPRLRFELETFTTNQPAHYARDDDYKRRKGDIAPTTLWVTGQFESARQYLTLLQSPLYKTTGFPELGFYDCHSCHTPMANRSWSTGRVGAGLPPGALRLNRGNLAILVAIAQSLGGDADAQDLGTRINALMLAGAQNPAQVSAAAGRLLEWIKQRQAWQTRAYASADTGKLRTALLRLAATDGASDYTIAEQVVIGVDSLSYALGDQSRLKKSIDTLYEAVADEGTFNPARFQDRARAAQASIK
jgi:hypothetical protein